MATEIPKEVRGSTPGQYLMNAPKGTPIYTVVRHRTSGYKWVFPFTILADEGGRVMHFAVVGKIYGFYNFDMDKHVGFRIQRGGSSDLVGFMGQVFHDDEKWFKEVEI